MRIFCGLAAGAMCILTLMTSGCNAAKPKQPDLNKGFSCTAEIKYDNFSATAEISRIDSGVWEIKLLAPSSLKDITLTYSGGDMKISYKGLSFNLPENSLPVEAITGNIVKALDNAAQGVGIEVEKSGDNTKVSGMLDDISYAVIVAPDGTVLSLAVPDIKLEATFDGFSFADVLP